LIHKRLKHISFKINTLFCVLPYITTNGYLPFRDGMQ